MRNIDILERKINEPFRNEDIISQKYCGEYNYKISPVKTYRRKVMNKQEWNYNIKSKGDSIGK